MKCPVCNKGMLKWKKEPYEFYGVQFGRYDAEVCTNCGEAFFTEEASDAIDKKARELGLWGLAKKTKVGVSGNSLIVRIPAQTARFMKLKEGEEVIVRPEGKKRLVVDI